FSSRRRHTRFSRDWSSDVCSSDLPKAHKFMVPRQFAALVTVKVAAMLAAVPASAQVQRVLPQGQEELRLSYAPIVKQVAPAVVRSEEHTSELQSRENLVCRLLLEK